MSLFFFFKQKTAYEVRISDWSSDVCSSDLDRLSPPPRHPRGAEHRSGARHARDGARREVRARLPRRGAEALPGGEVDPLGDQRLSRRSETRRVGQEGVRTCRSRGEQSYLKKKIYTHNNITQP